ncbi:MAG TPA: ComEC/Rec2 family competence protein [Caulobacteraceae bacterium]|nr:ComEC/Rec2 family competence protein [Caulobacteraceae bacterium]
MGAEVGAQAERAFLWTPVAYGAGAAAYLGLKTEPPLWPLIGMAAVAAMIAAVARRWSPSRGLAIITALLAVGVCGLAGAKLRTDLVAAPIAPAHLGVVPVEGFVVDVANPSDHGARLLIAPVSVGRLAPDQTPKRLRLVVPSDDVLGPGAPIRVLALVDPPPGPAAPGAYDFARDAFFDGIGGVGLAMKPPTIIDLARPPWPLRVVMAINAARWSLAERLAADVGRLTGPNDGGAAGLVVTVATSHEDWLDSQSRDDLRGSGLAHMLAIAGLHTAAVSGFVFFALRLGVAAWPWLALRVSGKKVAALGGLIAVGAYLVLSGAHPPARRAAITASVAFVAILCDRRAISLHSLSIAALVILLIQPEVVVSPGFEMSFCATAALVALAELWPVRPKPVGLPWALAALQKAREWTLAMLAVSFVAGMATGPFSIQHFNRVANYGVFANLTADFLASVALMPAVALAALGELLNVNPIWLGGPLWVAGWAARSIVALGHFFAHAPGASFTVPSAPTIALAISYIGIVFACLWRGRLRWIGVPMAAAVAVWPRPAPPVAWVAADADDAAIVVNGEEIALKPDKRAYQTQLWAQRRGFSLPDDAAAAQKAAFDCDRKHCSPIGGAQPALGAWWSTRPPKPEQADALCMGAQIVVVRAAIDRPPACAHALVLGVNDFAKGGAAEIFRSPGGWRVEWAQPIRGRRPWTDIQL